jgi:hypothetical protein
MHHFMTKGTKPFMSSHNFSKALVCAVLHDYLKTDMTFPNFQGGKPHFRHQLYLQSIQQHHAMVSCSDDSDSVSMNKEGNIDEVSANMESVDENKEDMPFNLSEFNHDPIIQDQIARQAAYTTSFMPDDLSFTSERMEDNVSYHPGHTKLVQASKSGIFSIASMRQNCFSLTSHEFRERYENKNYRWDFIKIDESGTSLTARLKVRCWTKPNPCWIPWIDFVFEKENLGLRESPLVLKNALACVTMPKGLCLGPLKIKSVVATAKEEFGKHFIIRKKSKFVRGTQGKVFLNRRTPKGFAQVAILMESTDAVHVIRPPDRDMEPFKIVDFEPIREQNMALHLIPQSPSSNTGPQEDGCLWVTRQIKCGEPITMSSFKTI